MDYDKLIEDLRWWAAYCGQPCGCLTARCILDNAVAAIETLCAENNRLREKVEDTRLEGYAKGLEEMSADLSRVTTERDLAVEYVRGQCKYCKHNFDCTSRKGPHSNCWEWRGIKED